MEEADVVKKKIDLKSKRIQVILLIIVVAAILMTGFYIVNPGEEAVVQRFGEYNRTTHSGLHFKLPFGIEYKTIVKVKEIRKEEFGFRTVEAGIKTQYSRGDFSQESLMLTGDLNIVDVQWIVQYRVKDSKHYLFKIRNNRETLRILSESATRKIVGDRSADEVITLSRQEIAQLVLEDLQEALDNYDAGIEVVTVVMQNVNPPKPVQPAFNEVNSARQEQDRIINEAQSQYNKIIPEAKGRAQRVIQEAEGYAINRVNRAQGDASRFNEILKEYRKAPSVTKKRMYLETMQEILPELEHIYMIDDKLKSFLPLLNMQKGGE